MISSHTRLHLLVALSLVAALVRPAFAQSSASWSSAADVRQGSRGSIVGSVTDLSEANNRLSLLPDDGRGETVTVTADAVTTTYSGFGGMINGKAEVFTGSSGFSNLRTGDRLEVRGISRASRTVAAEQVTLLGRSLSVRSSGVGTTRPPGNVSTPGGMTSASVDSLGRIEGVVRQVNANEGRIMIETSRRDIITIRGTSSTPIYYKNDVYQLSNLEPGDRIRVEPEPGGSSSNGEIRARTIDVIKSVQEGGSGNSGSADARSVGSVAGRVTRVDRNADTIQVDTGRGQVLVDVNNASDNAGRHLHARDIQVGDRIDISGSYGNNTDRFLATVVRIGDDTTSRQDDGRYGSVAPADSSSGRDFVMVTMSASITESLQTSPQLVVRESQNGRSLRIYVAEDFIVKTRSGTYITADRLKEGDTVVVKAYRDPEGQLIAQSIRTR